MMSQQTKQNRSLAVELPLCFLFCKIQWTELQRRNKPSFICYTSSSIGLIRLYNVFNSVNFLHIYVCPLTFLSQVKTARRKLLCTICFFCLQSLNQDVTVHSPAVQNIRLPDEPAGRKLSITYQSDKSDMWNCTGEKDLKSYFKQI